MHDTVIIEFIISDITLNAENAKHYRNNSSLQHSAAVEAGAMMGRQFEQYFIGWLELNQFPIEFLLIGNAASRDWLN